MRLDCWHCFLSVRRGNGSWSPKFKFIPVLLLCLMVTPEEDAGVLLTKRASAFSSCGWRITAVVLGPLCLAILQGVKLASGMKEGELGGDLLGRSVLLPLMVRLYFPLVCSPSVCAPSRRCPWPGSGPQLPRLGSLPGVPGQPGLLARSPVSYCLSFCLWLPTFCCIVPVLVIRTNRAGDKKQAVLPFWF